MDIAVMDDVFTPVSTSSDERYDLLNRKSMYEVTAPPLLHSYTGKRDVNIHADYEGVMSGESGVCVICGHPYPAPPNAAIEPHSQVLRCVLTSAAQAEHAELFEFARDVIAQRQLLDWAGYVQDVPTPIYEDNSATYAIVHKAIKQRKSKSWAMKDHATQEWQAQRVIDVTKIPGEDQLADYFTKNNPPALHAARTPLFVTYPAKPGGR